LANGEGNIVQNEPIGVAAVILSFLNILWVAFPDIRPGIAGAVNGFFVVLTSWYARRNSTPNIKVETTRKQP
jgi:hypothetical protein